MPRRGCRVGVDAPQCSPPESGYRPPPFGERFFMSFSFLARGPLVGWKKQLITLLRLFLLILKSKFLKF